MTFSRDTARELAKLGDEIEANQERIRREVDEMLTREEQKELAERSHSPMEWYTEEYDGNDPFFPPDDDE